MLDSDLAKNYGYTAKAFNRQVQRNIEKFDEVFMFQLNEKEARSCSRCQFGTLNSGGNKRGYNIKYLPLDGYRMCRMMQAHTSFFNS